MKELFKWINIKYNWFKENIQFIVIIPTLIGGIWQIIELSMISVSFIRFFSVSQLISDGLLILFICIIFYFAYKVNFFGSNQDKNTDNSKSNSNLFLNGIVLVLISIISFFWLCVPIFYDFFIQCKVDLFTISIGISISIILVKSCYTGLLRIITYFIGVNEEKTKNIILKLESPKIKNTVVTLLIPVIMLIIISGVGISIKSILNFRNSYMLPKKLHNIVNINFYFKNELNIEKKNWHILYFNDKYIFTQYLNKKGNKEFLILDFNILFNNEKEFSTLNKKYPVD